MAKGFPTVHLHITRRRVENAILNSSKKNERKEETGKIRGRGTRERLECRIRFVKFAIMKMPQNSGWHFFLFNSNSRTFLCFLSPLFDLISTRFSTCYISRSFFPLLFSLSLSLVSLRANHIQWVVEDRRNCMGCTSKCEIYTDHFLSPDITRTRERKKKEERERERKREREKKREREERRNVLKERDL